MKFLVNITTLINKLSFQQNILLCKLLTRIVMQANMIFLLGQVTSLSLILVEFWNPAFAFSYLMFHFRACKTSSTRAFTIIEAPTLRLVTQWQDKGRHSDATRRKLKSNKQLFEGL